MRILEKVLNKSFGLENIFKNFFLFKQNVQISGRINQWNMNIMHASKFSYIFDGKSLIY